MVGDDLLALPSHPTHITAAQLMPTERLNDQQPRRITDQLHLSRDTHSPIAVERGTNVLSGLEIKAQQIT